MLKNIVFDLGNVLFYLDFTETIRCLEKHLLPGSQVQDIFREVIRGHEFELFNKGKVSKEEFFRYVSQFLDKNISEEDFWHCYSNIFIPNQQLIKAIPILKKKFHLSLLSNTDEAHMDYLHHRYPDLFEQFHDKVYSYQVGAMKPEPEIFDVLCRKTGVMPRYSLFVDDLEDNVRSAEKKGFQGFLFKNNTEEFFEYIAELQLCPGQKH